MMYSTSVSTIRQLQLMKSEWTCIYTLLRVQHEVDVILNSATGGRRNMELTILR